MRVAVIIPSYNEADNIALVATTIDRGLALASRRFPAVKSAAIINVDNSSPDKTSEVFRGTPTRFPKFSYQTKGRPGKGKNLIFFLKKFSAQYDLFITLDADLKSLKPEWIVKLLTPLVTDRTCDFVWPIYKRSRFEGSTTNHFSYPLIYALFKRKVRQPIAGDFAFRRRLAARIVGEEISAPANHYGIDILFSIRALQYARSAYQINLGQKIHKPSFSKLESMFPQIAAAAAAALCSGRPDGPRPRIVTPPRAGGISPDRNFRHQDFAQALLKRHLRVISRILGRVAWLEAGLKTKVRVAAASKMLDARLWSFVLTAWLAKVSQPGAARAALSEELLPFFVFRAVSFWNEAEHLTASRAEKVLTDQTREIRKLLNR